MDDKCLIVVNNFEGADIHPTIAYPLILRQFDIALERADYTDAYDITRSELRTLWVPKDMVFKLNGNFSTNYRFHSWCLAVKYMSSIWPANRNTKFCLGPKSFRIDLLSKPWQCEIKIDLFLPDSIFRLGKHGNF